MSEPNVAPDYPIQHPVKLLSLAEFAALPEDNRARFELQEGILQVNPRPKPMHQIAATLLCHELLPQLPAGLFPLQEVDMVLDLGQLPTVRIPDVLVARIGSFDPAEQLVSADAVVLAIEIISPGSRRTDMVTKPSEYADAGIGHYWVIDLDPPVSLTAFHLAGQEFGYQEGPSVTGLFSTTELFDFRVDLDALALTP